MLMSADGQGFSFFPALNRAHLAPQVGRNSLPRIQALVGFEFGRLAADTAGQFWHSQSIQTKSPCSCKRETAATNYRRLFARVLRFCEGLLVFCNTKRESESEKDPRPRPAPWG